MTIRYCWRQLNEQRPKAIQSGFVEEEKEEVQDGKAKDQHMMATGLPSPGKVKPIPTLTMDQSAKSPKMDAIQSMDGISIHSSLNFSNLAPSSSHPLTSSLLRTHLTQIKKLTSSELMARHYQLYHIELAEKELLEGRLSAIKPLSLA